MKAYLFVTKIRIQSALAYRFNVISTILIQCLLMFAMACFWNAAYGGTESVSGVREQDMLTYTMVSVIMGNLLTMGVEGRIESSVRSGSVALDMLKPVNIYGIYLAEDLGDMAVALFQIIDDPCFGGIRNFNRMPAAGCIRQCLFNSTLKIFADTKPYSINADAKSF